MSAYLRSLIETALGWFAGGAVAVLTLPGTDLSTASVWRAAALAGAAGVLKGLAARYVGDRDRSTLT